jgi:hypothetical protein
MDPFKKKKKKKNRGRKRKAAYEHWGAREEEAEEEDAFNALFAKKARRVVEASLARAQSIELASSSSSNADADPDLLTGADIEECARRMSSTQLQTRLHGDEKTQYAIVDGKEAREQFSAEWEALRIGYRELGMPLRKFGNTAFERHRVLEGASSLRSLVARLPVLRHTRATDKVASLTLPSSSLCHVLFFLGQTDVSEMQRVSYAWNAGVRMCKEYFLAQLTKSHIGSGRSLAQIISCELDQATSQPSFWLSSLPQPHPSRVKAQKGAEVYLKRAGHDPVQRMNKKRGVEWFLLGCTLNNSYRRWVGWHTRCMGLQWMGGDSCSTCDGTGSYSPIICGYICPQHEILARARWATFYELEEQLATGGCILNVNRSDTRFIDARNAATIAQWTRADSMSLWQALTIVADCRGSIWQGTGPTCDTDKTRSSLLAKGLTCRVLHATSDSVYGARCKGLAQMLHMPWQGIKEPYHNTAHCYDPAVVRDEVAVISECLQSQRLDALQQQLGPDAYATVVDTPLFKALLHDEHVVRGPTGYLPVWPIGIDVAGNLLELQVALEGVLAEVETADDVFWWQIIDNFRTQVTHMARQAPSAASSESSIATETTERKQPQCSYEADCIPDLSRGYVPSLVRLPSHRHTRLVGLFLATGSPTALQEVCVAVKKALALAGMWSVLEQEHQRNPQVVGVVASCPSEWGVWLVKRMERGWASLASPSVENMRQVMNLR